MRYLLAGLMASCLLITAAAAQQEPRFSPVPVQMQRPSRSTILVMPVPQETLDMLLRGTLITEFEPAVLESVLRGSYQMPTRPDLPPLPTPRPRVAPEEEVQLRWLSLPDGELLAPQWLPQP